MRREDWTVTKKSSRPLGNPDECFYCKQRVGSQHSTDCVIRQRTVVLNCNIKVVMPVPEQWDEEMINFHLNESSWCADNLVRVLNAYVKREEDEKHDMPCLCERTTIEYVGEADGDDEKSWGLGIGDIKKKES